MLVKKKDNDEILEFVKSTLNFVRSYGNKYPFHCFQKYLSQHFPPLFILCVFDRHIFDEKHFSLLHPIEFQDNFFFEFCKFS